ncbi:hypothetical protein G5V57_05285 [Nordella sp. HKS 07]|uniref:hypothetical protein n=1 Tax=Nordella sp. HKS 07 TaxID=2712222 RepID=UPI0013E1D160|nr:hypothetical protein [Nordella sp. HKS 07]QIG47197.1 hypothetical protein G5V57_05285 [Nordella sp. HKS 07]
MTHQSYAASPIKRSRATRADMEERAAFMIDYAKRCGPVTVRGLYYQCEVHGLPGIDKTEAGYDKVQRQVLSLRRQGRMSYDWIADATRWMLKPHSFDGAKAAIAAAEASYHKDLWIDADSCCEIWCEKDAISGVILPVTELYDVPLMVTRGFSSETFCFEAIAAREHDRRPYHVYYLGDFDRAGRDAARSLRDKLNRFASEKDVSVVFEQIAVDVAQINAFKLPTREPKRKSPADRAWPYDFACELDALPPDTMRDIVEEAINRHLPAHRLNILKTAEASERAFLKSWASAALKPGAS